MSFYNEPLDSTIVARLRQRLHPAVIDAVPPARHHRLMGGLKMPWCATATRSKLHGTEAAEWHGRSLTNSAVPVGLATDGNPRAAVM